MKERILILKSKGKVSDTHFTFNQSEFKERRHASTVLVVGIVVLYLQVLAFPASRRFATFTSLTFDLQHSSTALSPFSFLPLTKPLKQQTGTMEDDYNDSNRAFLQAFMGRSSMTFEEAQPVLAAIFAAKGVYSSLMSDFDQKPLLTIRIS